MRHPSRFFLGVLGVLVSWCCLRAAADEPPRGLRVEATDGQRTVRFARPVPHLTLAADESIHPRVGPRFRAVHEGLLRIVRGCGYLFRAVVEPPDAATVVVTVAGKDALSGAAVALGTGDHPLRIAIDRTSGAAVRVQLRWSSDAFAEEPIPTGVLFLSAAGPEDDADAAVDRGRELVRELNCAGCHAGAPAALAGRPGPDLTHVGSRANAAWIAHWLAAPRRFRAGAVMPVVPLDAAQRADVAAYLAGLRVPQAPDADPPSDKFRIRQGKDLFGKIGCAACHRTNDLPLDGLGSKWTASELARFLRDPHAADPSGRMPAMGLNDEEAALLAEFLVSSRKPEFEESARGDPAKGRAAVAAAGCLGCHALNDGGVVENTMRAPAWDSIRGNRNSGCLAELPTRGAPGYAFTNADRAALAAYLDRGIEAAPAPVHEFYAGVKAFRCTACHALEGADGTATAAGGTGTAPPLTGAGHKLRTAGIEAVLVNGRRLRPWKELRMPRFGSPAAPLVPRFAAASGEPLDDARGMPADLGRTPRVREGSALIGRGRGRYACVECHETLGRPSPADDTRRGPEMSELAARLRPDWFRRWLLDPARISPGTPMPTFFAGRPAAESDATIDLLWTALSAGTRMPVPPGLEDPGRIRLDVADRPVVFRSFLPDCSPHGIAVGLPGGVSYAFDALACRVRYAWSGDFLDVTPVWAGRGGRPAEPQGPRWYAAPDAFPIRIGDGPAAAEPQFLGYTLVNGRPEFRYRIGDVRVLHAVRAPEKGPGLLQDFRLVPDGPPSPALAAGPVRFLAGNPKEVTITSDAGEWEDTPEGRSLKIAGGSEVRFMVTVTPK